MTTYFVTTGMSLLTSSRCWNGLEKLDDVTSPEIKDPSVVAKNISIFKGAVNTRNTLLSNLTDEGKFKGDSRNAIQSHSDRLISACSGKKYYVLPAELATILLLGPKNDDNFVFLHGTGDNQKVAHLLCAILELWKTKSLIQFNTVKLAGPFEWNPVKNENFQKAMVNVWVIVSGCNDSKCFILTGGYKGVLISLTNTIAWKKMSTKIYYAYGEEGHDLIEINVIEGSATDGKKYIPPDEQGL